MTIRTDGMTEEERLAAEWASLAEGSDGGGAPLRVLSQDEIDSLLGFDGEPTPDAVERLVARLMDPAPPEERGERPYGMFEPDGTILRFFDDPHGEATLADIRELNRQHGTEPVTVPGTGIELLNFSKCPRCGRLHSAPELAARYARPPHRAGVDLRSQLRRDTCVACLECGHRFQPTLLVIDSLPRAERQFLCRVQTVEAIEAYHEERWRRPVLGRKPANRIPAAPGRMGIRNDVAVADLAERPTLLSNLLQYTPASLAVRFIDGANLDHGDLLFGQTWPA